jgi:lactate dehydrogenase-like 2-hydroxyacid dehydrogenase
MTRIVFLDRGTMGPLKQLVRPAFAHEWIEHDRTRPDEVVERLASCDIAISNKVPIRREIIARLPRLKMIAIPATGYDAFDIDACVERGIVVSNVRGYAVNTVPEHTFALILALRRSLAGYRPDVIAGRSTILPVQCWASSAKARSDSGLRNWAKLSECGRCSVLTRGYRGSGRSTHRSTRCSLL